MSESQLVEEIGKAKDAFQKAKLLAQLREKKGITLKKMSEMLDMKQAYICHYLRLLKLPEIVVDGYYAKLISATHLFIIARLRSKDDMMRAYEKVLGGGFTSQQTEELIREILFSVGTSTDRLSKEELQEIQDQLSDEFPDVKVKVRQTRIKGTMFIEMKGPTAKTSELLREISTRLAIHAVTQKSKKKLFILD